MGPTDLLVAAQLAVAAGPDSHNGDPSPTETTGQLVLSGSLLVMFSFTSP
jgi:hypothetical protein